MTTKRTTCRIILFCVSLALQDLVTAQDTMSIVLDKNLDRPALHGIHKLQTSLEARGYTVSQATSLEEAQGDFLIVAGLNGPGDNAKRLLRTVGKSVPEGPEALVIHKTHWQGKQTLVLCGSDDRGLMYAALDTAQRIGWSDQKANPFSQVKDQMESPDALERAISMYTMHRAYFEQRLFDPAYWARYFDMLAQDRFNSFVVIFGYENGGFMAPLYPYFFDVAGFPDVRLIGLTQAQQTRNTAAFKQMIHIAHDRGIHVTVGIWDHIYRGGVQGGGIPGADSAATEPTPGLVWGVTTENLSAYNQAAIRQFIETFPEVDAIQFRMHWESGLKQSETRGFWKAIFSMIKQMRPDLKVDARAKGLPDEVLNDALDLGIDLRVTTKYWMEQMGLPFHPTHINTQNQQDRRHGYADLLRYPKRYNMHWRLWNGGTTRVLLWADPDYVRTFVESTHLYNARTFEVQEPLATKMLGESHDRPPADLLNPAYRYYDWEFERYWHFYQVFGRLGYNPQADPAIWQHEFQQRFGVTAAPFVEKGLHLASQVLPRIVASCNLYRYFPTTRGWVEKMRMGDLPEFATAQGSDIQLFANFQEEANNILQGIDTPKLRPEQNSQWFAHLSESILAQVADAKKTIANPTDKEFISTTTDLNILACLADYYARRIPAAVSYNLFKLTGDVWALDQAIAQEQQAVAAWARLVQAAGDVYADDIIMGVRRLDFCGHWRDELVALKKGVEALTQERISFHRASQADPFRLAHVPVRRLSDREPLVLHATMYSKNPGSTLRALVLDQDGSWHAYPLQNVADCQYHQVTVPNAINHEPSAYYLEAISAEGQTATLPKDGQIHPIEITCSADREPPVLTFTPVTQAKVLTPIRVTVRAEDASGIRAVRLRYRHVTQFEDYKTLDMTAQDQSGTYTAEIPADFVVPQWDVMYFIEALDNVGNGKMYPSLEEGIPYVITSLKR